MALCAGNSGTKRGREMIKGSKDVARVLVGTEKKILVSGVRIFCE